MTAPTPLPLPMRVKAFLVANPDEQLTAHDVSVKFSTSHKNVHTQLARAVDSGELVRSRNADGDYVYTAGKAQPMPAAAPKPAPAPAHAPAQATRQPRQPKADVDLLTLPIATDIPLPTVRRAQQHAHEALDRLTQPGHSFAVPLDASGISALRKAITDRHNTGTQRYVARALPTEFRVWRTA